MSFTPGGRDSYRLDAQLLADLWFFRAAAQAGSITLAAARLCVTQGAVSQRVQRLEDRLQIELFHRRKGGIALTSDGAEILAAMDAASSALTGALRRLKGRDDAVLVISCPPSLATEWLLPNLHELQQACPDVELHVRSEMGLASPAWMEAERIDLLIDYVHAAIPKLHEVACIEERIFPVCAPGYGAFLEHGSAPAVMLLHDDCPWQEGEGARAEWHSWDSATGRQARWNIVGERHFNQAHLSYQAAAYGQGIAMGRAVSVNRLLRSHSLVAASDAVVRSASYRILSLHAVDPEGPVMRVIQWMEASMRNCQQDSLALI